MVIGVGLAVVDQPVDPIILLVFVVQNGVDSSKYQYLSRAFWNILGTLLLG